MSVAALSRTPVQSNLFANISSNRYSHQYHLRVQSCPQNPAELARAGRQRVDHVREVDLAQVNNAAKQ